jgi:Protein of unknown function (DUF3109)
VFDIFLNIPFMYIIQDILVSDDVLKEQFLCNLNACKGACCWEGDLGAPVALEERAILDAVYPKIKSYLTPAGIAAIEAQGTSTLIEEDESAYEDYATTLIEGGPCAFITYEANGIAKCGIEKAYLDGVVDFKKPISCHLYPIRVSNNGYYDSLNYDRWDICSDACQAGKEAKLPVYQFLKDPLVRRFGLDFYEELDAAAKRK